MRKKTCIEWFENNLKEIAQGKGDEQVTNIAIVFTAIAKEGSYDNVSDAYYSEMLEECEILSKSWNQFVSLITRNLQKVFSVWSRICLKSMQKNEYFCD